MKLASKTSVEDELIAWAKTLYSWQQDALRRIIVNGGITPEDMNELVSLCKQGHGLQTDKPVRAIPLRPEDMRVAQSKDQVALKCIRNVEHVNALAEGQTLQFNELGLTIAFGLMGAGKSGYARILKKVCRARSPEEILPNVYKPSPSAPPSAEIHYLIGNKREVTKWQDGKLASAALAGISVFDSACAVAHVEGSNDIAYTPYVLHVLERLAQVCRDVKQQLTNEKNLLGHLAPASLLAGGSSRAETSVGKAIAALSAQSDPFKFEALAAVSEADREQLNQLKADLAKNPELLAKELEAQRKAVERVLPRLEQIEALLNSDGVNQYKEALEDYQTKREAAKVAAGQLFSSEPLPHVGSQTWQVLWKAARAFSKTAYETDTFPVIKDGAVCVLCHQELTAETKQRLTRFEAFVQANTHQSAQQALGTVNKLQEELKALEPALNELISVEELLRLQLDQSILADDVRRFRILATYSRHRLLRRNVDNQWLNLGALPESPAAKVKEFAQALSSRIGTLKSGGDREKFNALRLDLETIEDRIWLARVLPDVKREIDRKKHESALTRAINETSTYEITAKSSDWAKKLVTNALRDRFADEIRRLGLSSARVELAHNGSNYGVPQFRVSLIANPTIKVAKVLSKGEHRCIALAAFLAELATTEDNSGIVFDDPVSSEDHLHRDAIAKRLVEESLHRQVIVFSHDISFVYMLGAHAEERGVNPSYQTIDRGPETPGICQNNPPLSAYPVLRALDAIEQDVSNYSHFYNSGEMGKWGHHARGVSGNLRDCWERAVEEVVSPVYRRFQCKVKTGGLRFLTVVQEADCTELKAGWDQCSEWQHTYPDDLAKAPPRPDQLRDEIDRLRRWLKNLKSRQDAVPKH